MSKHTITDVDCISSQKYLDVTIMVDEENSATYAVNAFMSNGEVSIEDINLSDSDRDLTPDEEQDAEKAVRSHVYSKYSQL